ncbi:unnamed protein product [Pleuronectes platessa]|uniref:Uncharacterized protein n=1 Tax=Pleuronectes platessa TaxID=8262 RepID=A0A9N7U1J4_PLEPL|nr:unnamed protein product [Pleuronectes platessa]
MGSRPQGIKRWPVRPKSPSSVWLCDRSWAWTVGQQSEDSCVSAIGGHDDGFANVCCLRKGFHPWAIYRVGSSNLMIASGHRSGQGERITATPGQRRHGQARFFRQWCEIVSRGGHGVNACDYTPLQAESRMLSVLWWEHIYEVEPGSHIDSKLDM